MPSYQYRYVDDQGSPLLQCPGCFASLIEDGDIKFSVCLSDMVMDVSSRLDEDGYLTDVEDLVENGYHAGTYCGGCGELLMDLPGVTEVQSVMDEANKAFKSLRDNPEAWAEEQAERKLWEGTLLDDIEEEG